jgi:hypothetical protein
MSRKAQIEAIRNSRTPEVVAQDVIRLTGGRCCPERTAETYRIGAENMRRIAEAAARSPSGKANGYTEAHALEMAGRNERNAVEIPAAIRRLLAA